ncbi:hypothetical protein MASR1M32_22760 [Rhodobacter sp.]
MTDDTEQALLLAGLLIEGGGRLDEKAWANALIGWEADVRGRGLRDLLGPSSKRALEALLAGTPASETGLTGTTNGAAMRIAPVGIATPPGDLPALVAAVQAACRVTHATREAIAAAAAVAAVISQGIDGADFEATLPLALEAARLGSALGAPAGEADMAGRIEAALQAATDADALAAAIGTSVASRESVAAAFGVVRLAGAMRGRPRGSPRTSAMTPTPSARLPGPWRGLSRLCGIATGQGGAGSFGERAGSCAHGDGASCAAGDSMTRLVQLSGVCADLVYRVEAVPAPGSDAVVRGAALMTAGGGFNAMVAARRAGLPVAYAGTLGTGPWPMSAPPDWRGRGSRRCAPARRAWIRAAAPCWSMPRASAPSSPAKARTERFRTPILPGCTCRRRTGC